MDGLTELEVEIVLKYKFVKICNYSVNIRDTAGMGSIRHTNLWRRTLELINSSENSKWNR